MADADTADGSSLTDNFNAKSLWHWSHWLMLGSMVLMAMPLVVATAPAGFAPVFGFGDWAMNLFSMYVSGYENILSLPEVFSSAVDSASSGIWYTGAEAAHGMNHGASAAAGIGGGHVGSGGLLEHCSAETANSLFGGMSGAEFESHKAQAGAFRGGDMVGHFGDLCHS